MPHRRTLLALLAGIALGFGLALGQGVLAEREPARAELPAAGAALLAEVLGRVRDGYVEPVDERELMQHALRGMVSGLDPHSAFLDAAEYEDLQAATGGHYSGIGIEVSLEEQGVIVVAPLEGSPAERAGLRSGDAIIAVDGTAIDTTSLADAIARLRGLPGTPVHVTVERPGVAEPLAFDLRRADVQVLSVRAQRLGPGQGYLRISQFSDTTAAELESALAALARAGPLAALVLDLRNNPGGVLEAGIAVADAFLDRGLIVTADGRGAESRFSAAAAPGELAPGVPLAVLVNGGSASAAEIVAAALRDHGRAVLVGRRTFGKGSVQTILPLSGGQALKLTTSRYRTPAGVAINGRGLVPDVVLPRPAAEPAAAGRMPPAADPEVRAAFAALAAPRPSRYAAQAAGAR